MLRNAYVRALISAGLALAGAAAVLNYTIYIPHPLGAEGMSVVAMVLYLPIALFALVAYWVLTVTGARKYVCRCRRCKQPLADLCEPQCPYCSEQI